MSWQGNYEPLRIDRPPEAKNKRWPDWVQDVCIVWARSDSVDLFDLLDMLAHASREEAS